jgi:uncharacterized heparinase superfamily protein
VIAWITQSPLILEDADRTFYRRFLRSLVRQVRRLRIRYLDAPDGYPRLLSAIAVAEAALSMDGQSRLVRQATQRLELELNRQVLPDGGHVSRNPGVVLELLTDLLPLRQAYAARGLNPAPALLNAIDRMMPLLRFFRHVDGAFAQFNGMGATLADQLATVLAHDDARGAPVQNATHSGYQRIESGGTVLIVDTGGVPPLAVSGSAHAGFLSFEMSSGHYRFVVNCGTIDGEDRWRQIARTTAAHSTLTVEDSSSARFIQRARVRRRLGTLMVGGPQNVSATREERDGGQLIVASHDGYASSFGLVHRRSLHLSADGDRLSGTDRLTPTGARIGARDRFAIRFHLHPAIRANRTAGGEILLVAPDGEVWTFAAATAEAELAESVFLSAVHGRRRSMQIVLQGRARVTPEVAWTLTRTARGRSGRAMRTRGGSGGADLFE